MPKILSKNLIIFDGKNQKMRQSGLKTGGEHSVENLTYKLLRRKGYVTKLRDIKTKAYDKLMSIDY